MTVKEYKDEGELVYTNFYFWKFTFSTFLKARSRVGILNRYVIQILAKLEKVL